MRDEVEVGRSELLPVGRFEELRALPQLDDQNGSKVGILLYQGEMQLDEAPEPRRRVALLGQRRLRLGEELGHLLVEQTQEQVVFALEIQVDGTVGDARRARDLGDGGAEIAALGEDLHRRVEDPRALVVPLLSRLHRGRPALLRVLFRSRDAPAE